ncbi:MAG: glycosyltransferase family 4 protein [Bacteroidetes bacterium]|nr:glycosyltransferase family 4 protein [Bacteroidota bacterium]
MILISTQCFPPDIGGIENLMGGVAEWLSQKGIEVTVFADGKKSKDDTGRIYRIRRFVGPKPFRRILKSFRIRHFVKNNISANDSDSAILFDSWKSLEPIRKLNIHKICFAHGNELMSEVNSSKWRRICKVLKSADLIIANSNYTAMLLRSYEINPSRIKVFYPPINPQPAPDEDTKRALESKFANKNPILATVARLEPRKGIDTVIRSLPELIKLYPNLIYLVGGEGNDRQRLEKIINDLKLKNHVKLLGQLSKQQRTIVFSHATLFVMPTRQVGKSVEGFGISYIEAGWYGVPSIASQIGGGGEAVINDVTGLVVDLNKPYEFTMTLVNILGNRELRNRLGAAAQDRSRNILCWDKAIDRLIDIIDNSITS